MAARSLAVGSTSIDSLYNNALDCFEYVQLGNRIRTDVQTDVLKLANARLRLSRWGQAVGLSEGQNRNQLAAKVEDTYEVESCLREILGIFSEAEGISSSVRNCVGPEDPDLGSLDLDAVMDHTSRSLHKKMNEVALGRRNNSQLQRKTAWTIYREEDFKKLIQIAVGLINRLADTSPATQAAQKQLCDREIASMDLESLRMLLGVAAAQDKDLKEAILKTLHSDSGTESGAANNYNYGDKGQMMFSGYNYTVNIRNITFN